MRVLRGGRRGTGEPAVDPFGERRVRRHRFRARLLGGDFRFESDSAALVSLARDAFGGLPAHKLGRTAPVFTVHLALGDALPRRARKGEPPLVQAFSAPAMVAGALAGGSFMSVAPRSGSALVVLAPELLRYPYHARYELLEFAVYCLAGRAQQLVPLHAACVGGAGAAALLLGASGAGKSTLTLHCLLGSLELLAEDSVLVEPRQMLATGVGSFLHLRMRARHYAEGTPIGQKIARSPVIRRRSGERKFEFDLRAARLPLARAPLPLRTLVFLSRARAAQGELLVPLSPATATRRLAVSQRYAASQPGWQQFLKRALQLPAYELRRGAHPGEGAAALARILASLGQRDAHPKAAKSARAARARTAGGKDSLSRPAATFAAATNS